MTESSRFFDSASYTETQFAEFMRKIMVRNGVIYEGATSLQVSQSSPTANMGVLVASGEAWIQGFWYSNSAVGRFLLV